MFRACGASMHAQPPALSRRVRVSFALQFVCRFLVVHRASSSPLGPVAPSFRALSGRLKFTVRRHKIHKDSPPLTDSRLDQIRPSRRSSAILTPGGRGKSTTWKWTRQHSKVGRRKCCGSEDGSKKSPASSITAAHNNARCVVMARFRDRIES